MGDDPRPFLRDLERKHRAADRGAAPRRRSETSAFGPIQGGYDAGKTDRLTEHWMPGSNSPTAIHRADATLTRARARNLLEINPLAESAVQAYLTNVLECGITPKPLLDDKVQRWAWVAEWDEWAGTSGEPQADLTGQQHLYDLIALALEEVIVGGGCLQHYVTLSKSQASALGQRIPLSLELIPEERFADDRDTYSLWHNKRKGANPIVRGVEVDSATGRPINYWIRPADPTDASAAGGVADPIPLPASQCRYVFFKRRVGQQRGITLLAPAVMWLWKLGYYTDNELMNSAVRSCVTAMVTRQPGTGSDDEEAPGLYESDSGDDATTDAAGNRLERLQPGVLLYGEPGEGLSAITPNTPPGDAQAWLVFIERMIAIGIGLSYEELCRDYSKGSFSSVRASMNSDRKRYKRMQSFVIRQILAPLYSRFIRACVLAGIESFPTQAQFVAGVRTYLAVKWRTPGWISVKPSDDAKAFEIERANGVATREDYIAAKGGDQEELDDQREREQQDEVDRGLVSAAADSGDLPPDDPNDGGPAR